MLKVEKKALLDASLERAAELLGDITPQVMAAYYARQPGGLESFEFHSLGDLNQLEGQMIEQVIYCLMQWYESPGEIEIILLTTIPHHIDTLKIAPQFFADLIEVTCDVIAGTIPAEATDEQAVWEEVRHEMQALCAQGAAYSQRMLRQSSIVIKG